MRLIDANAFVFDLEFYLDQLRHDSMVSEQDKKIVEIIISKVIGWVDEQPTVATIHLTDKVNSKMKGI